MIQENLLQVKGLKKYFPVIAGILRHQVGEIKAVDGVDFHVASGEVLGMVGESGSGKSTAARAAIRLIEPTEGHVHFEGRNLLEMNGHELKEIRKKIQMIFQDPYASLNPRKTIGDSIGEALIYHGLVKSNNEKNKHVVEALDQVGLSAGMFNRYPHQFSGGQQQRICIARAIALKPKLLVCDEAVSALDVSVQAQILNLLNELKSRLGLSYLFISHDLSVVRYMSDRVVVMLNGKIVEENSAEELYRDPQNPYTKKLLAAIKPIAKVPKHSKSVFSDQANP